ncbi:MAG: hypothetical protein JO215_17045 [Ktedonobacteraceae bacterium]|nr:hypothetical protein [Ktedonobacteraceae bacterium]
MKSYNFCILGFGNIGRALAELLLEKTTELREYDIEWHLTGVATRRLGWIADPQGLDVAELLSGELSASSTRSTLHNVYEWLDAAQVDVLFELTSLNVQTGQPAIEHIRAALERGAYAVTANKGPLVHAYQELTTLALAHNTCFMFDATVMAGAPIFSLFHENLPLATLLRFRGLLNSTANIIIAEMEQGRSFDAAVRKAQELGLAETDPSADVDGWDATVKICAISTVLMNVPLKPEQVQREGIRDLSIARIQEARASGKPFKLVARVERIATGVFACVRPEQLEATDPLASVGPASLLAHFEMDVLPGLTTTLHVPTSGTAGPRIVAYDVLADFLRACKK